MNANREIEKGKEVRKLWLLKVLLCSLLSGVLICVYFYSKYKEIILSSDLLFWTFSTVMQSFMALGALLGMVAVFRLQVINSRKEKIVAEWKSVLKRPVGNAHIYSPEEFLNGVKKLNKDEGKFGDLKEVGGKLENLMAKEGKLKNQILTFIKKSYW